VLCGQSVDGGYLIYTGQASMDMDISMDIHAKSVDMDMDMDGKFHIHGNPENTCVGMKRMNSITSVRISRGLWDKFYGT